MSADCGERKKWRARSISCDDGSGCASGVSCDRLCGGLYLGDDWPCVLLRAIESFACTTLPRRSWILLEETINHNRLLDRPQELSWLDEPRALFVSPLFFGAARGSRKALTPGTRRFPCVGRSGFAAGWGE